MLKNARTTKKMLLALAMASAMCLALSGCAGGVPDDQVKQDVVSSSITANGLVPGSYVEESTYELTDLKVGKQEDENNSGIETRRVDFSGKIANENFESTFTGHAYYAKQGDSWISVVGPTTDSGSTIPLKGVDGMTTGASLQDDGVSHSDFQSSFNEENGKYFSSATETVAYEFWFADDTATNTQDFTFDPSKGWLPQGDMKASELKTTYKLAGKTFNFVGDEGWGYFSNTAGKGESSLAFTDSSDNSISAAYALDFTAKEDGYTEYTPVSLKGTAAGKPSHKFGESSFSVELNDKDGGVTFSCQSKTPEKVAGSGTVNALIADVNTNTVFRNGKDTFSATDMKYAEAV